MPQKKEQPHVYRFICEEVLTHGTTGEKHKCGKTITSLSKGQFDYWVREHKASHEAKRKGISTAQVLSAAAVT